MKIRIALLAWTVLASAGTRGGHYFESTHYFHGVSLLGGPRMVYVRTTCDKRAPGQFSGKLFIRVSDFAKLIAVSERVIDFPYCPTLVDVAEITREDFLVTISTRTSAPPAKDREAIVNVAPSKLFLADSTGPSGRSSLDVLDPERQEIVANIDVDDRLLAGVVMDARARRAYGLLWPSTSPAAPAFVAYIDTTTNRIIERLLLPELQEPQKPALSRDGRLLYFSARTGAGFHRIQVADLQSKTVAATFPAESSSVFAPKAVALSPDGRMLCAAAQSGVLCYDVATRTLLRRITVSVPNASIRPLFHPNGSRVYELVRAGSGASLGNYILVLDTSTLSEVLSIPLTKPSVTNFRDTTVSLAITPNGDTLVVDEGSQGVVNFIDTRTNRIVQTTEGLATGSPAATVVLRN